MLTLISRQYQPSGLAPVVRSIDSIPSRIASCSSSRVISKWFDHRYPCPAASSPRAASFAATAGLRSSATAAAKKVTGIPAASKMRKSRQIPARDPYS